jgi:hypothetical protein
MPAATERIVVQVTLAEKRSITKSAEKSGLNLSEFMRRAAKGFRNAPEDGELESLLDRAERATKESISMIDDALAFLAASEERIAELEGKRRT